MKTPPLSRSLPVLALYNAAVRLGLAQVGKKRKPVRDDRQLELKGVSYAEDQKPRVE